MATNEANLLSTPSGYATPEQLKAMREYAKALMQPSQIRPLAHWMPAVADAVKGLTGGYLNYRAGERERESQLYDATRATQGLTGAPVPPTQPPGRPQGESGGQGGTPPAQGTKGAPAATAFAPEGNTSGYLDPATYSPRLGGFESGGRYDKLGPVISNPGSMYAGDRAYGKYQVMGKNIPEWTKAALGVAMTPQQFLASPDAQEQVFKHRFGQYLQRTGNPQDAASMWFTGQPVAQARARGAKDQLGTDVNKYVASTVGNAPAPQQALPFTGQPADAPQGEFPQSALAAAARGAPATPQSRVPTTVSTPGMMQSVQVPAGLVPPRAAPAPGDLINTLASQHMQPWMQQLLTQKYLERNQPQELAAPFGKILVPSGGGGQGTFIPTPENFTVKGQGGQEITLKQVWDPVKQQFMILPMGGGPAQPAGIPSPPGASGAPAVGPATGAQGGGVVTQDDIPGYLNFAPEGAQGTEAPPTPAAGASEGGAPAAAAEPPGMLGQGLPPEIMFGTSRSGQEGGGEALPFAGVPAPPAQTPAAQPQAQGAQYLPPTATGIMNELDRRALDYESQKGRQKEESESLTKANQAVYDAGKAARNIQGNIAIAKDLIGAGAIQGIFADPRLDWQRFKAWVSNDPKAAESAASTQVFQKSIAGAILNDMKIMLQGLGQVRVAEIQLLQQAAPSIYNEPEANKVILDLTGRAANIAQDLSKITSLYNKGLRLDAKGNLIRDASGQPVVHRDAPTREGLERMLQQAYEKHPDKVSPETVKQYREILATGINRKPQQQPGRGRNVPQQPQTQPIQAPQQPQQPARPALDTFLK